MITPSNQHSLSSFHQYGFSSDVFVSCVALVVCTAVFKEFGKVLINSWNAKSQNAVDVVHITWEKGFSHQDLVADQIQLVETKTGMLVHRILFPNLSYQLPVDMKGKSKESFIKDQKKLRPILLGDQLSFHGNVKSRLINDIEFTVDQAVVCLHRRDASGTASFFIEDAANHRDYQLHEIKRFGVPLGSSKMKEAFHIEALCSVPSFKKEDLIATWVLDRSQVKEALNLHIACEANKKIILFNFKESQNLEWERKVLNDMGVSEDDIEIIGTCTSRSPSPAASRATSKFTFQDTTHRGKSSQWYQHPHIGIGPKRASSVPSESRSQYGIDLQKKENEIENPL